MNPYLLFAILMFIAFCVFAFWAILCVGAMADEQDEKSRREEDKP